MNLAFILKSKELTDTVKNKGLLSPQFLSIHSLLGLNLVS